MNKLKTSAISLVALVAFAALGQSQKRQNPLRHEIASQFEVAIAAEQPFEEAVLRVAGRDGIIYKQLIQGRDLVTYQLVDQQGALLPDGHYNYELVAAYPRPSSARRSSSATTDRLKRSVELPNQAGRVERLQYRLSGSFEIRDGRLIPDELLQRDQRVRVEEDGR